MDLAEFTTDHYADKWVVGRYRPADLRAQVSDPRLREWLDSVPEGWSVWLTASDTEPKP